VDTMHVSDNGLLRWTPCMSRKIAIEILLYKSIGFLIEQSP
jgi:hypothetical protein